MPVGEAVLDGEIACLDGDGKPIFNHLLWRRGTPTFCAFDLLWLDGKDLRSRPLVERKAALRKLTSASPSACVLYVDGIEGKGTELFKAVCEADLEGIVAKRRDGLYTPEETSWVKIKNRAYSQAVGRHELFEKRNAARAL